MGDAGSALALFASNDLEYRRTFLTATASRSIRPKWEPMVSHCRRVPSPPGRETSTFNPDSRDDFSATFLSGVATYDQYDTPYAGERWATFNSSSTSFPGEPSDPDTPVETPSRSRGTYFVGKLQWLHDWRHSLARSTYTALRSAQLPTGRSGTISPFPTVSSRFGRSKVSGRTGLATISTIRPERTTTFGPARNIR